MILSDCLPSLGQDLLAEIEAHAPLKSFSAGEYIIQEGQVVRFLPIVIEGSVKMFSHEANAQFLLYFINAGETCIFSFAHLFNSEPVAFSAIAELDSQLLLLPVHKVREWFDQFPSFAHLILKGYQQHYTDLLNTTKQLVCYNLEERLLEYLKTKVAIANSSLLSLSHQQIAEDLGSSREVITRVMKKLAINNQVEQVGRQIKVL